MRTSTFLRPLRYIIAPVRVPDWLGLVSTIVGVLFPAKLLGDDNYVGLIATLLGFVTVTLALGVLGRLQRTRRSPHPQASLCDPMDVRPDDDYYVGFARLYLWLLIVADLAGGYTVAQTLLAY